MDKIFLVIESKEFYDGHGCGEDGGIKKYTSSAKKFQKLKPGKKYTEDWDEGGFIDVNDIDKSDEDLYAQDGYHCTRTFVKVKVITAEQQVEFNEIIKTYNKLK